MNARGALFGSILGPPVVYKVVRMREGKEALMHITVITLQFIVKSDFQYSISCGGQGIGRVPFRTHVQDAYIVISEYGNKDGQILLYD